MSGPFDPRLSEILRDALEHHGDAISRAFYARLGERRLSTTQCGDCGALSFPPRGHCPACASADASRGRNVRWADLSGRGRLHAFTQLERAYFFTKPDVIGLVDLEEGCGRVLSRIVAPIEGLRIGQPMRVDFLELPGGLVLHQFLPDNAHEDAGDSPPQRKIVET